MENLQSIMRSRRTVLAALVIVAIIVVSVVSVVSVIRSNVAAQSVNTDWPSFTMIYEIMGSPTLVGRTEQSGTEVRRMEYTSKNSWTDTVTEAPDIETTVGTFNLTGSFMSLDNGVITEYDSITGTTTTVAATDGVSHVAGAAFVRNSIDKLQEHGYEFTQVETDVRVCFQSVCEDNASGIRMEYNNREYIFVDDVRGIPLKRGATSFKAREVLISDSKQPASVD